MSETTDPDVIVIDPEELVLKLRENRSPGYGWLMLAAADRLELVERQEEELTRLRASNAELLAACRNQVAWIERLLETLEYRVTQEPQRGHGGNGFAFAAVPDWDMRQKLESLKEDITKATTGATQ